MRRILGTTLAIVAMAAAGCGGDDEGGGSEGGSSAADLKGQSITVWNNEFQPDRMRATEQILADFTKATGVKVKQVAVPEDQLSTLITNASAAGKLPDVVLATPVADSHAYAKEELFDPDAAQEVVERLGADTFSKKALDLVSVDGKATGVPSDGWGQLLIYRKDMFEAAGSAPRRPSTTSATPRRSSTRAASPASRSRRLPRRVHARDLRARGARDGLPARRRRRKVTSTRRSASTPCATTAISARTSPCRAARTSTPRARRTSRAGGDDVLVALPARRNGRAAQRHEAVVPGVQEGPRRSWPRTAGLVGPLAGWRASRASSAPCRRSTSPSTRRRSRAELVEFMMSDGYVRWLGLSPQGKYPVRLGDSSDPEKFTTAWAELESGVDSKAPLSKSTRRVDRVARRGRAELPALGLRPGPGRPVGALTGEQPIANAVADVIGGKDPARPAAKRRSRRSKRSRPRPQ
jgi:multiple sugar transport system substrate-binding protein